MLYSENIQQAVDLAIKTHEVDQKQKRKGKDIAYISHPLTVGLILARANAPENVVIAGLLHDVIEDSIEQDEVSRKNIESQFGKEVVDIVMSVTEKNKELKWEKRKENFLQELKNFSQEALLLKSADIINNLNEIVQDYNKEGDKVFKRFNASKDKVINHKLQAIDIILDKWLENPLVQDLEETQKKVKEIS